MARTQSNRLVEVLVLLKRAAGGEVDPASLANIVEAQDMLSELAGRTVRPAQAARLLGVSQPALKRWIDSDDIPTVLTAQGRVEVPVATLVDLIEEVERSDAKRPLSAVIRRWRRESDETANLNTLVPPRRRRGHEAAQLSSLAYHRLVADRLDPLMIAQARRRLDRWAEGSRVDPRWIAEWRRVLALPPEQLKRRISSASARAGELRQTSPFAGFLTEQERRRLAAQVEDRFRA